MRISTIIHSADLDDLSTWVRYRNGLCDTCYAVCCTMPAEVRVKDLVRLGFVDEFDLDADPKQLARQLQKQGIIEHFNFRHGLFTLARRSNGDCRFLDPRTRRCSVYEQRPDTCRKHPQTIGPRPGYCAFRQKG